MSDVYREAVAMLEHAGNGRLLERKKLGNNTYGRLVHPDGEVLDAPEVRVMLHGTDVVTFLPDGTVRLDSGGWRTVTTKERMNRFAPNVSVYSARGVWYVRTLRSRRFVDMVEEVRFYDGLTYDPSTGAIVSDGPALDAEVEREDAKRRLKERVRAFVRLLEDEEHARALVDQALEGGTWTGDCWYCLMRDEDGVPLGDATGAHWHLEQHLEDEYVVPSLLRNAFRERYGAAAGDTQLWVLAMDVKEGRAASRMRDVGRLLSGYFVKRLIEEGCNA